MKSYRKKDKGTRTERKWRSEEQIEEENKEVSDRKKEWQKIRKQEELEKKERK